LGALSSASLSDRRRLALTGELRWLISHSTGVQSPDFSVLVVIFSGTTNLPYAVGRSDIHPYAVGRWICFPVSNNSATWPSIRSTEQEPGQEANPTACESGSRPERRRAARSDAERRGDGAAGPSGPDRGGGSADRREARGASEGGSEGTGRAGGPRAGGPGTSGGAGERVPSAGWREVASALGASKGVSHR